jgi:polysaccharide export outer membrane protein
MVFDFVRPFGVCLVMLVGLTSLAACGGGVAVDAEQQSATTEAYYLDTDDQLALTVYGEPEMSGVLRVTSEGTISVPLAGQVSVRGKTLAAAEKAISKHLGSGYLKQPKVTLNIVRYRPFFILGQVRNPAAYDYVAGLTVRQAVAIAGGFGLRADDDDIELRRGTVVTRGDLIDHPLNPGDVVTVQERLF